MITLNKLMNSSPIRYKIEYSNIISINIRGKLYLFQKNLKVIKICFLLGKFYFVSKTIHNSNTYNVLRASIKFKKLISNLSNKSLSFIDYSKFNKYIENNNINLYHTSDDHKLIIKLQFGIDL